MSFLRIWSFDWRGFLDRGILWRNGNHPICKHWVALRLGPLLIVRWCQSGGEKSLFRTL